MLDDAEAGDSQGSRTQTQAAAPTVLKMCGSEQDATLSLNPRAAPVDTAEDE